MDEDFFRRVGNGIVNAVEKKKEDLLRLCRSKCRDASDVQLLRYKERFEEQGQYEYLEIAEKEMRRRGL